MAHLTRIFKALSDENRLAIFELLRRRCGTERRLATGEVGQSVTKIAKEFDLSLSTVSHHLRELRMAGLIRCEKRGQWVHCSVDPDALKELEAFTQAKR